MMSEPYGGCVESLQLIVFAAAAARKALPVGSRMVHRHTIDATTYVFDDLRDLLAKAAPPRSGDRLAEIAADSAEQMIAARSALADIPLKQFLNEAVIPYEDDEITRLIIDTHDA